MCGISGFYSPAVSQDPESMLRAMTDSIRHRGPDGQAIWLNSKKSVGLGHARLSIIDLEGGKQPMESIDGRHVIVFNGEIYNYQSIRHQLEALGHQFRTNSDTEVLLEAYKRWGAASLNRFRGMFAFAIYDRVDHLLFLARDRTGIKPLYYYQGPLGLYFASEMKSILTVTDIPRRLNYRALADYLVLGYPLLPDTLFSAIQELAPGTWLQSSPAGISSGRFWKWQREPAFLGEEEALTQTEEAITQSLREHLIADVPVGALLSGGIDSSLLVAMLVKVLDQDIQTFTVGFSDAGYDESPYARRVAKHLGTRHHEILLDTASCDLSLVDEILCQFDQPFGDSSAIPTFLICREIRKFVKVVIGGDGGDEMFGGYERFRHADLAKRVGALPGWCLKAYRQSARGLRRLVPNTYRRGDRFMRAAGARNQERLVALSCYTFPEDLSQILLPAVSRAIGNHKPAFCPADEMLDPGGGEFIDCTIRFVLPGDYLRKVDTMSSAHGLEVRVPLLGEHVLDCSARIEEHLKYSSRGTKKLLRKLAHRFLPREIATKPKAGFSIPLDSWLGRRGREQIMDMLDSPGARVRQLICPYYVQSLLTGFVNQEWDRSGRSRYNLYQQVYLLWSLEKWLNRWQPSL